MDIEVKHVSLIEICIHDGGQAPIVIADLLPYFPPLSSDTHVPVMCASEGDVLDGIPNIVPLGGISKKTPVVVFAKQVIGPRLHRGFSSRNRLASRE
jgi:hypothetical protein